MQTQNIVFGFNLGAAAQLKIGAYGAGAAAAVDVGRTEGGVEFSLEREMVQVDTDQDPGPTAIKEIRRFGKLKFSLAEATLENLAIALNLPTTAVAAGKLSMGAPSGGELYREVFLYVDGPAGGTRTYWVPKCSVSGAGTHAYMKDGKTVIEVEMDVLWDTAQAAGEEMGTYEDAGGDTTAPTVELTTPVDGGTVLKDAKSIVVWTITEANQIDASTLVYGDTFQIINTTVPASAALVAGTIAYNAVAKTVTFTPTANWTASETMQAIVSTGLKDLAGNRLAATKIEQFSVTA